MSNYKPTGWVASKDHYAVPVLFNPYTGEPRDVRDVQNDPRGVLIVPPGKVEMLAAPSQPAELCEDCRDTALMYVGSSGTAEDGNAAIMERCPSCGYGEAQPVEPVASFLEHDPSKFAERQGLFQKFEVRRIDGSDQLGGRHYGCCYFVLDLNHDRHASAALRAYAESCKFTHPKLSADLFAEFEQFTGSAAHSQISNEEIACAFHAAYEELAPGIGYETRIESRKEWLDVPEVNRKLMIAVVGRVRALLLRGEII